MKQMSSLIPKNLLNTSLQFENEKLKKISTILN